MIYDVNTSGTEILKYVDDTIINESVANNEAREIQDLIDRIKKNKVSVNHRNLWNIQTV